MAFILIVPIVFQVVENVLSQFVTYVANQAVNRIEKDRIPHYYDNSYHYAAMRINVKDPLKQISIIFVSIRLLFSSLSINLPNLFSFKNANDSCLEPNNHSNQMNRHGASIEVLLLSIFIIFHIISFSFSAKTRSQRFQRSSHSYRSPLSED